MNSTDIVIAMRHIRVFGLSGFELTLIVLLGAIVVPRNVQAWCKYLLAIFATGIIVHWMFGVNTALNWQLGLAQCPPDLNSLTNLSC